MTGYVALLRAVNVGGTGKLPMRDLAAMCEAAGFTKVRTYIASGNVVFESPLTEASVKAELESRLAAYAGRAVGVCVRSAREMAAVCAANPFAHAPGARAVAIFLDQPPPPDAAEQAKGQAPDELIQLGAREIYVLYGAAGQGHSKLRIPAAKSGTARNLNTVARLAQMAAEA